MRLFIRLLLIIVVSVKGISQIPAGYYNTATGTGFTLKTQLYNIIKNHNDQGYGALWDLYTADAFRDNWYEDNGSLLDIYSEKPTGTDSYEYFTTDDQCGTYSNEGDCYNREHLFPQGFFNEGSPMKNDAHFVVPSDGKVNGQRGSYPFGRVGTTNWVSTNGSKLGNNLNSGYSSGYSGIVFEPINAFKGDVARAMLYVATRYQNVITNWDSWPMVNGSADQVYANTFKNILLTWHLQDPVSEYEIAKNNEIYYHHQGNRNPYIDHPEWVTNIWGSPADIHDEITVNIKVFPNPTENYLNIESDVLINSIEIYTILGEKIFKNNIYMNSFILNTEDFKSGVYYIFIDLSNSETLQIPLIKH